MLLFLFNADFIMEQNKKSQVSFSYNHTFIVSDINSIYKCRYVHVQNIGIENKIASVIIWVSLEAKCCMGYKNLYINSSSGVSPRWALFQYPIRHLICKISWSLEAARFVVRIVQSLWNLTGISAALLLMNLYMYLWLVFISPQCCRRPRVPTFWLLPHSLRPAVFIWCQFCILYSAN